MKYMLNVKRLSQNKELQFSFEKMQSTLLIPNLHYQEKNKMPCHIYHYASTREDKIFKYDIPCFIKTRYPKVIYPSFSPLSEQKCFLQLCIMLPNFDLFALTKMCVFNFLYFEYKNTKIHFDITE